MKPHLKLLLVLVFCLSALAMCGGKAPADAPTGPKTISIIYTTDMQGKLESCG